MKVAIIGAGYTGMTIAKRLSENNIDVTIFDKESQVGGMTRNVKVGKTTTDRYYRHIFKSDKEVINLAKELNVEIEYFKSKMGYYIKDGLYDWGQVIPLLKFKPLSFVQKMKFGISVLKIKAIRDWKGLEQYTIKEWFVKNKIEDIYSFIWEPLLKNKFGDYAQEISMVWLWGKINLRKTETSLNKETLGYIDFEKMNNNMQENLSDSKVVLKLNTPVKSVEKKNGKYKLDDDNQEYDIVISTIAYEQSEKILRKLLTKEEKEKLEDVKYIGAKTMILEIKKKLTNYYWLNIADEKSPFCGIIDYHNMENIPTKDIIYISNYIDTSNRIYKLNKEELLEEYLPFIKKVNKNFNKKDILNYEVIDEQYAQTIIETNYSEKILNNKLKEEGLYIATAPQIYPEDRGVNYAIRSGYKLADEIMKELKDKE